jgi:hypothetical protein
MYLSCLRSLSMRGQDCSTMDGASVSRSTVPSRVAFLILDGRTDSPSIRNLKSLLVTLGGKDVKLSTARTVRRVGRRAVPTPIEVLTSSDDEVFAA